LRVTRERKRGSSKFGRPAYLIRVKVLLEIDVEPKCAAANLSCANNHPRRCVSLQVAMSKPVSRRFVKSSVIEENEAANIFGSYDPVELSMHNNFRAPKKSSTLLLS
jgi:hypothetical protein